MAAAATAAPEVLPDLAARISAVLAGPEVLPAVLAALRVLEAGSVFGVHAFGASPVALHRASCAF